MLKDDDLLKSIQTQYLKELNSTQPIIKYPLHVAAALGDIATLKQLLKSGVSIELRDDLNLTPLHVAAISGQAEAVSFLISKGANVFAVDGYKLKLNALDLSILEGRAKVVEVLIKEGHMLDKADNFDLAYVYNLAFDTMRALALYGNDETHLYGNFNDSVDTFVAIVNSRNFALLEFPDTENKRNPNQITGVPASILMEIVASLVKTKASYEKLMSEIAKINAYDSSYQTYLEAKAIFHVLPIKGEYDLIYRKPNGSPYLSKITAEGHWGSFTTPLVYTMLETYMQTHLNTKSLTFIKKAFEHLLCIYEKSCLYSKESGIFSHAQEAYTDYLKGEMVLLPTGWNGHFVNVILDPIHEYFIVANCGMRFHTLASGANIYKMHNPSNLDAHLIYAILNNTEQIDLELFFKYQLALDKIDILWQPAQIHGNCAWQSHEPAVEALLYLHFLNENLTPTDAKVQAHDFYVQWDTYQTFTQLQQYFEGEPKLGIQAIKNMLFDNHPSLFIDKYSKEYVPINPTEYEQAKFIVSVLTQEYYKKDVYYVFSELYQVARMELRQLFKNAGFAIKSSERLELEEVLCGMDESSIDFDFQAQESFMTDDSVEPIFDFNYVYTQNLNTDLEHYAISVLC